MKVISVTGTTLPEAYHKALYNLEKYGDIVDCPDWNTSRKEVMMTMTVLYPFQEPMISKFFIGGPYDLERYRQEMLDGILDFEIEKGKWVYTYHDRMTRSLTGTYDRFGDPEYRDQIQFVIDELTRNPLSTRAVIDVRNNIQDMYSDDPACLQHIQYFIRNNKLDCAVLFRSNDAVQATFMNAFALILLQKRIADKLGIEVGSYIHTANSFHCYEKNFEDLHKFSGKCCFIPKDTQFTYFYEGDWKDLMEDEKEAVAKVVEHMRNS